MQQLYNESTMDLWKRICISHYPVVFEKKYQNTLKICSHILALSHRMDNRMLHSIEKLLEEFQCGKISKEDILQHLHGISDISFAQVDIARKKRTGQAECIFGENKTAAQIIAIASVLHKQMHPILVTRVSSPKADIICRDLTYLCYDELSGTSTGQACN